jgi:hypothetical protein
MQERCAESNKNNLACHVKDHVPPEREAKDFKSAATRTGAPDHNIKKVDKHSHRVHSAPKRHTSNSPTHKTKRSTIHTKTHQVKSLIPFRKHNRQYHHVYGTKAFNERNVLVSNTILAK